MALIECPECGGKVSDKAPACIHCGYPLKDEKEEQAQKQYCPYCGKPNSIIVNPIVKTNFFEF